MKKERKNSELHTLVEQAQKGDQAAFTELYERTHLDIYRTVRSMVREDDQAMDIQQEVYLRAYQSLPRLGNAEAFLPWLRKIAVHAAVDYKQNEKRQPLSFSELNEENADLPLPDPDPAVQPELSLDRKETSRLVREILDELPASQQLLIGMHYYEQMSIQEIAEQLHLTTGAVKAQLYRGRRNVETRVRSLEAAGTKLYGLSPVAFLMALLRRLEPKEQEKKENLIGIMQRLPGEGAVAVTAVTAGNALFHSIAAKLLAGGLALSLLVGGKLIYDATKEGEEPRIGDVRVTETLYSPEPDPTAESDVQLYLPTTEPDESEPDVSEPDVSEPDGADPATPDSDLTGGQPGGAGGQSGDSDDQTGGTEPTESSSPETDATEPEESTDTSESTEEGISWSLSDDGVLTINGIWTSENENDRPLLFDDAVRTKTTQVVIHEGVETLWAYAFYGFSNLRSVELPNSLSTIGTYGFYDCTSLRSVELPNSLTKIGLYAFSGCTALSSIKIPDGVTQIEGGAFYNCTSLRSVELPNSLTVIEDTVFEGCTALSSIRIPNSVTSIESHAFFYCEKLSSVEIPNSVTNIGENAFMSCISLSSIDIPDSVTSIGIMAFLNCANMNSVRLPSNLTEIPACLFRECSKLSSVSIPRSVTVIRESAFMESGLTSVTIPDTVTSIEYLAFDLSDLTTVTIPGSVKTIGYSAFGYCRELRSATIADGVETIEKEAFIGCNNLHEITIPASVSTLGVRAFGYDDSFSPSPIKDFTIHGVAGSAAEQYAAENGFTFVPLP